MGGKRMAEEVTAGPGDVQDPAPPPAEALGAAAPSGRERSPVQLRVVWGDLCRIPADVHVAGHYQGVMPVSAEGALDAAISGPNPSRRIIAEHTRRQWFMGDFGHVNYFPSTHDVVKLAAVAGMGRPGTFTPGRAARLAENLLVELCALGDADRLAMVGIGTGAGNLSYEQAAHALVEGFAAALTSSRMQNPCMQIDIVEFDRLRAERFLEAFTVAIKGRKDLVLTPELLTAEGGRTSFASAAVYALRALVTAAASNAAPADQLRSLLEGFAPDPFATVVLEELQREASTDLVKLVDVSLGVAAAGDEHQPVRISVLENERSRGLRVAAITGTATVPERQIDADPVLIDEIVARMSPPQPDEIAEIGTLMSRMVLPADLQTLVSPSFPLVFEVDRRTARIHWELVADLVRPSSTTGDGLQEPLVLQTPIARQLRTGYSRVPALDVQAPKDLRVLVIGDPGGPRHSLDGARNEAIAMHEKLTSLNIPFTALIGSAGEGRVDGFPPATRLGVLRELSTGTYQVVHYSGHGTFDPADQRRAGWLFADGILSSRELAQVGTPPRLVVANACFSSQLGGTTPVSVAAPGFPDAASASGEALLTPSLADEFFRCGVGHYVGAAWPVDDEDAVAFSRVLYELLLDLEDPAPVGEAVRLARREVWRAHVEKGEPVGTTWGAYQHYGDPTDRLLVSP